MEKIDFIVTWVDGNDPLWQEEKHKYENLENNEEMFEQWNNNKIRYRDWEVLKYWFRGIEKNAPWVNKIYFVTYGHLPNWLNTENEKLQVVKHEQFIPQKYLPTFNSNAIELNLHRIDGLSDKFVYFNDDVYLIRKTKVTDFFKNGLPLETAAVDCTSLDWDVGHSEIKNVQLINKYFNKREVLKKYWKKWLSPKNGKQLIKTILLLPWKQFTGIYEGHITSAYLKNTFEEVWKIEDKNLDNTCTTKFRNNENLNHWIFKNWQLVSGKFLPRSSSIGKMYFKKIDDEIIKTIENKKYKIVCINDVECTDEEFIEQKQKLINAFENIFPEKSSFEK